MGSYESPLFLFSCITLSDDKLESMLVNYEVNQQLHAKNKKKQLSSWPPWETQPFLLV